MFAIMLEIILYIMLPILLLVVAGAVLQRIFSFHMPTLSKLLTFFFLPVVVFTNIAQNEMDFSLLFNIGSFLILQFIVLALLSSLIAKLTGMDRKLGATFKNSVVLMNSGNFGLPVSQLVFAQHPIGVSVQIIVLMFQNLITYTYGITNAASSESTALKENIKVLFQTPIIYALLLGAMFQAFSLNLPEPVVIPMDQVADGFIALALLVLGAQVAYPALKHLTVLFFLTVAGRLIGAPLIGLGIIYVLGIDGVVAQALLIASAFPMSRNSALFALEYDNYPEYAAQGVLVSTLLSVLTVPMFIYLAQVLFG
ncbi:hypothetical protein B0H94_11439 [Salsuginibacillus halophilus]|uniref:AEC family transporter n=1 Tax=Salsuginibacillus halophilus TaxID=517424 RepID=A0A2P8H8K2_9BACI|nr:AEC family transporter [Salsuginibacillus halophilus]PSL42565.1 hypothetical protein B0H94_11439 [Salsuginibacillus halophilus]